MYAFQCRRTVLLLAVRPVLRLDQTAKAHEFNCLGGKFWSVLPIKSIQNTRVISSRYVVALLSGLCMRRPTCVCACEFALNSLVFPFGLGCVTIHHRWWCTVMQCNEFVCSWNWSSTGTFIVKATVLCSIEEDVCLATGPCIITSR